VSEAVATRKTCRAFLSNPVDRQTMERLLEGAARAPSGGNLQPWRVWALTGEPLSEITRRVASQFSPAVFGEVPTELSMYPLIPKEPFDTRKFQAGEAMYEAAGIARADDAARFAHMRRNFEFFGAPVGLFFGIDRIMQPGQWAELGMFMQTFMLLAREEGLHTAPIAAWMLWHRTVRDVLQVPDELVVFSGMALGHMDEGAPINNFHTPRAPLEDFASLAGW